MTADQYFGRDKLIHSQGTPKNDAQPVPNPMGEPSKLDRFGFGPDGRIHAVVFPPKNPTPFPGPTNEDKKVNWERILPKNEGLPAEELIRRLDQKGKETLDLPQIPLNTEPEKSEFRIELRKGKEFEIPVNESGDKELPSLPENLLPALRAILEAGMSDKFPKTRRGGREKFSYSKPPKKRLSLADLLEALQGDPKTLGAFGIEKDAPQQSEEKDKPSEK